MLGVASVAIAYLLGSVSSAIVVARAMGLADPRAVGSGNPGATNVLRHFGRRAAALTLAGDALKGLLPVLAARLAGLDAEWVAATGVAAFLGHLYPLYFGFRGGKGVATYLGVLAGLGWPWLAVFAGTWLAVAAATRYSSLSALTAAVVTPLAAWWLGAPVAWQWAMTFMTVLVLWRHRSNIEKLLRGLEDRIGEVKSDE